MGRMNLRWFEKNYLFAGSDARDERAAAIYGLIGTAKLNGLKPGAYLRSLASPITASVWDVFTSPDCSPNIGVQSHTHPDKLTPRKID